MIKQTDTHRAVTETDLQIVERAISNHEVFQKDLFVLRQVLREVGNLDQRYRGLKEGIAVVEEQGRRVNAELEAAHTRLAEVQQQEVEVRKRVAALTAQAEEQQRMISSYAEQIDRITGAKAA